MGKLDRDNDGDFEKLIAAHAMAISPTRGRYAWTVNGPPSRAARVLVSWSDDLSVCDASDVTFQIRRPRSTQAARNRVANRTVTVA
jgi:hypothetical protein